MKIYKSELGVPYTRDFLDKQVEVGDYIFYSTTGRYPSSRYCRVVRFTEKSMFVRIEKADRSAWNEDGDIVVKNTFVKIEGYF